ncbi:hypothetical protein WJX81_004887 [Elliptochloris bilobata]|uniref:Uncharacterized protein n=1 Tax=Elliptochloris bilobata TaxID=381761 RepID=A0AAW1QZR6_9CHLO
MTGEVLIATRDSASLVAQLHADAAGHCLAALQRLRAVAAVAASKAALRDAGGVEALVELLAAPPCQIVNSCGQGAADTASALALAVEALLCLVADDTESRARIASSLLQLTQRGMLEMLQPAAQERLRRAGGVERLVALLGGMQGAAAAQRALLAVRLLTDREGDRTAIVAAGGLPPLVALLGGPAGSEGAEHAAAALGNLAAGGQAVKDALRQVGAVPPLVRLLREQPEEPAAELAAVALRNMALANAPNRSAIAAVGGLGALLRLLAAGQERLAYPMRCQASYAEARGRNIRRWTAAGACCFDLARGQLCLAHAPGMGFASGFLNSARLLACLAPAQAPCPRSPSAMRFSLLRKVTITEPHDDALELCLGGGSAADKKGLGEGFDDPAAPPSGAPRVAGGRRRAAAAAAASSLRLERLVIVPCAATEVKGAIMRMLTRLHLEREFKLEHDACAAKDAPPTKGRAYTPIHDACCAKEARSMKDRAFRPEHDACAAKDAPPTKGRALRPDHDACAAKEACAPPMLGGVGAAPMDLPSEACNTPAGM